MFGAPSPGSSTYLSSLPAWYGCPLLIIAAVLPDNERDTWGSMWPLVGYDNAIDAIYTRGPWLTRYQELLEQETDRNVTDGLAHLFESDSAITK
jgi:hypothetical protein